MVRPGEGRWAPSTCLPTVHLAVGRPIESGTEAVSSAQARLPARETGQPCACAGSVVCAVCSIAGRHTIQCSAQGVRATLRGATGSIAGRHTVQCNGQPGRTPKQGVWPKEG